MKKINNEENNYGEKDRKSLETVKKETSNIFDDATSDKEFSKSFLTELINKNEKLSYELANALMLIEMDMEKTLTNNIEKIKKYRILIISLGIISMTTAIINGYIGLISLLFIVPVFQEYFETGVLPEFTEDIKKIIISILKNDLDSEENDIEKLLEEARKKVSFEVDKSTVLELFIKEGSKNGKTNN